MRKNTFVMTVAMLMGTMALGCAGSAFAAGTTLESATKTALEAAGVAESDVIFEKKGTSFDDGREIYEIDFFVPGQMKYDFDIDTTTGAIVGQDKDFWDADDDMEYAALINQAAAAKTAAPATTAAPAAKAAEVTGEMTEAQAKEAALKDAGLTEADVVFTKCVKDVDDSIVKFEIDFRAKDGMEYEYDFSVADGTMLDKNVDMDAWDD